VDFGEELRFNLHNSSSNLENILDKAINWSKKRSLEGTDDTEHLSSSNSFCVV
jgi:hypothetical protein